MARNILHIGSAKMIGKAHSKTVTFVYYEIPFTGKFDALAMHAALIKRSTAGVVASVKFERDGVIGVEKIIEKKA